MQHDMKCTIPLKKALLIERINFSYNSEKSKSAKKTREVQKKR